MDVRLFIAYTFLLASLLTNVITTNRNIINKQYKKILIADFNLRLTDLKLCKYM